MNPASEDVKDMLLAESSLGLTFGTNLYIGKMPPEPPEVVVLTDYSGLPPQLTLKQGEDYFYPSLQVKVRSTDYLSGWALIRDIEQTLHGRANETWNGTLYTVIYTSSGPAFADWDDKDRPVFIINFNLQRR